MSVGNVAQVHAQLIHGAVGPGTYNLVARSMTIAEVADQVATVYPGTERLHANQDLPFRNLRVARDPRLDSLVGDTRPFVSDLEEFRDAFMS